MKRTRGKLSPKMALVPKGGEDGAERVEGKNAILSSKVSPSLLSHPFHFLSMLIPIFFFFDNNSLTLCAMNKMMKK